MGKRGWWALVLIVVIAGAIGAWRISLARSHKVTFRTEEVRRTDIKVQVSATGTLNPVNTVQVGSQVSGTISALNVDFNDRVRKGQVLAQLDPTFLKAQVAQSSADLNAALVHVRQAERDSTRIFPLGAQGLASKADLDNAQTTLDAARAAAASARAGLERAETNLRYATIISPIDGVVVSRDVDVGQTVAASLSAPTIYTIAQDLKQMQLEASVDEADIGQVQVRQQATFTVDAYPDQTFRGEVHQIRLSPETVQNVVTYTVVIYVSNPEEKLLPGMTANVTILVKEARGVLAVPSLALRFRPPQTAGRRGGAAATTAGAGGPRQQSAGAAGSAAGTAFASNVAPSDAGTPSAPDSTRGGGRPGGRRWQQGNPAGAPDSAAARWARRRTGEGRGRMGPGGSAMEAGPAGAAGGEGAPAGGAATEEPTGSFRHAPPTVIYVLGPERTLRPVRVKAGASDGTLTAVYSDSLREGDQVVLSMDVNGAAATDQTVVNPFAPRFPGGGGRGGGRR